MATRLLLADLLPGFEQQTGHAVAIESVGGVAAARRVLDGEPFDVVLLAADVIDQLIAAGRLEAGSQVALVHSGVAAAVRSGERRPDLSSEEAVRQSVLAARSLGYSTGPSGVALVALFERWGIAEAIKDKLVQAPSGLPVGSLVANGEVELGFQQLSELIAQAGIDVVGPLPPELQITTTFCAGIGVGSAHAEVVRELLAFIRSPQAAALIERHGLEQAQG